MYYVIDTDLSKGIPDALGQVISKHTLAINAVRYSEYIALKDKELFGPNIKTNLKIIEMSDTTDEKYRGDVIGWSDTFISVDPLEFANCEEESCQLLPTKDG